jgi:hypothetical protein
MVELTIERIADLAGEWTDGSRASAQFQEIIQDEQTTTDEIASFLTEAVESTGSHQNHAFQDLVNNIGERLGFAVDYGLYQGTQSEIGYDGRWISTVEDTDTHLVVESKKSTAYAIDPSQAGDYMDELAEREDIDQQDVYGLYVVGDDDLDTVAQTILGSPYRDRMRVISAQRLLALLTIQERSGLRHEQVVDVLLPINTADVGQLVGLIRDVIEFQEQETTEGGGGWNPGAVLSWQPQIGADAVQGTIERAELEGPDDAMVAVFPSQQSGVEFLKENNAWGFVRINQNPEYVAMYISEDVQAVRYIAEVAKIVPAGEAQLARTLENYVGDQANFDRDKKVVVFEPDSLYRLEDEIPLGDRVPYSLRYTELGRLKSAASTNDIL